MSQGKVRVEIGRTGKGIVEINGIDIADMVEEVHIDAKSRSLPQVTLVLDPTSTSVQVVGEISVVTGIDVVTAVEGDGG